MEKEEFIKKLYNIFSNLSNNSQSDVYRVVGKEFGYFDLPQKRTVADLADFEVLYRGFRKKIFVEEFLFDDDKEHLFLGNGDYGKGIYTSKDKDVARRYTNTDDNMLRMYIKKVNAVDYIYLVKCILKINSIIENKGSTESENAKMEIADERVLAFIEFLETIDNRKLSIASELLGCNISAMAIILGYDAIDLNFMSKEPNYLVLNRGKLHVLESDHSRVLGESMRYRRVDPEKLFTKKSGQMGE